MDDSPTRQIDDPGPAVGLDEAAALLDALLAAPPNRLTACRGWTVHDLTAHLAAGAHEEASLIEETLAGCAERATAAFAERELPFRELSDEQLRERLFQESVRLAGAIERLGAGVVTFTGHAMSSGDFAMHTRSECAVHRWDLIGRDDLGWAILGQPELTSHAVAVLGSMPTLNESLAGRWWGDQGDELTVTLRSEPFDDVVIEMAHGAASVRREPISGGPADVELDAAARLLLLWGRREPSAPIDLRHRDHAAVVDALLIR